jgi:hypothetical protein
MGLLKQLMIFGKSGLQGLPTRVAFPLRDIQLRLSKGATGVPLFTIWDSVAGPGTPMSGNNSGRSRATRAIEPRHRPPGQRWILDQVLRGGVPGRPPFWRTLKESYKGLGSVTLKINTQHTRVLAA